MKTVAVPKQPRNAFGAYDSTVYDVDDKVDPPVNITITQTAYQKIRAFTNAGNSLEISTLGLVDVITHGQTEPTELQVSDVFLVEQKGSMGDTTMDSEAIAKLMMELIEEGVDTSRIRCWHHTHGTGGVFWSGTDHDTASRICAEWVICLVTNVAGDMIARLDLNTPFPLTVDEVPVRVILDGEDDVWAICKEEVAKKVTSSFSGVVRGNNKWNGNYGNSYGGRYGAAGGDDDDFSGWGMCGHRSIGATGNSAAGQDASGDHVYADRFGDPDAKYDEVVHELGVKPADQVSTLPTGIEIYCPACSELHRVIDVCREGVGGATISSVFEAMAKLMAEKTYIWCPNCRGTGGIATSCVTCMGYGYLTEHEVETFQLLQSDNPEDPTPMVVVEADDDDDTAKALALFDAQADIDAEAEIGERLRITSGEYEEMALPMCPFDQLPMLPYSLPVYCAQCDNTHTVMDPCFEPTGVNGDRVSSIKNTMAAHMSVHKFLWCPSCVGTGGDNMSCTDCQGLGYLTHEKYADVEADAEGLKALLATRHAAENPNEETSVLIVSVLEDETDGTSCTNT